ncbi:MAG: response regulator [Gammaproteobacteria bacterium]|jgi:serine phosphatase RsbU (regulator of sigma subunit)
MTTMARILTIEDDPAIRRGIVTYLEDSGFEMLEAADGTSGIERFRSERPDVVLCDLRLPGMDGMDVLTTIIGESPGTPVIIVSGITVVSDAVQALRHGAWDYVTKPVHDMGVLESTIHRVLERVELLRENREYREHLEVLNRDLSHSLQQLREDAEAGRKVQHQFLPAPQQRFGSYVFSQRLFPSTYLSGDFVDFFPVDDSHVGFYIADVSGHGAASAFVTVMLTTLINQYREAHWEEGDDTIYHPARVLRRLNRDMRRQNLEKFATIFYGVIDRSADRMVFSTGAQFPYPIMRNGREARFLKHRSRPVGLFDDSRFEEHALDIPDEFVFFLISDGLLELLPQTSLQEKFGTLIEHVTNTGPSLDEFVAGFGVDEATDYPDDITFFRIDRRAAHE